MEIKRILFSLILVLLIACKSTEPSKSVQQDAFVPPTMGWASWNHYHANISEDIIKAQADAMVQTGLSQYGYRYINIDDGYFGGRDANGGMLHHPERFPKGMKHLAEYIHGKGLKAGIYSDAGINTCASHYDQDTIGAGMGLFGHEEQDLRRMLQEWDYDYIKVDWCGANWLNLDEETQYTKLVTLARRYKPDVVFNVCRWEFPGQWVTKQANSWRISTDIRNNFNSVLKSIDHNADLWKYASAGHYNDMDMLQIGRGMSYEEDKTHFTFWCLMHSPLLLGNDLTELSAQTLEIVTNEELIEINQSPYVYQARRIQKDGDMEIWGRPLVSTMSGEVVIALLNRSRSSQLASVTLSRIGIDAKHGYTLRDLWSKEEQTDCSAETFEREVPSHGVVVLKIKGKSLPFNFFQFKDGGK